MSGSPGIEHRDFRHDPRKPALNLDHELGRRDTAPLSLGLNPSQSKPGIGLWEDEVSVPTCRTTATVSNSRSDPEAVLQVHGD